MALPVGFQIGLGAIQALGGLKTLFGNKRPDYEIPDSAKTALALAKAKVMDPNMPGYSQAKDDIGLIAANTIKSAQEGGSAMEALSSIQANALAANRDLAVTNAQDQSNDILNLERALGAFAQYEDQEFQMDEFAPFADRAREGRDIVGAGVENLFKGLDYATILKLLSNKDQPAQASGSGSLPANILGALYGGQSNY